MVVSTLDLARMADQFPEGLTPGTDLSPMVLGTVTGLDIPSGLVQVAVAGSDPLWVPAAPFIYVQGGQVRVRRSPLHGGRPYFCDGPVAPGPSVTTGEVVSVDGDLVTVATLGGEFALPFVSSTYDVGSLVMVLRHPTGFGVPQVVLGLAGAKREAQDPGSGAENPPVVQARQAVFGPHDSGATRSGRWGQWNAGRFGGEKALWQGNMYGSGPLVGWAGYGDQVVNLAASRITAMWVDVKRADTTGTGPRAVVLQGSPHGVRTPGEPDGNGDIAGSGPLALNQSERILLPGSTYEGWRTGGYKGLRTVGGDYFSGYGAGHPGAMVLTVQYEVTV